MAHFGWKHNTEDDTACLDFNLADEGEIDMAYKLIEGSI